MRRVLRAKLLDIERRERAAKRGGYSQPLSLDAPAVPGGTQDTTSLGALLPDDDPERTPDQLVDRLALRSLIERAVSRLSPRQRRIVQERGSGTTMAELSRLLAVPRPTLYDELERIKAVFRDEGLEEFLR
jgi:RNA polymerase sigma-70 factor (ECF subfamily)